MSHELRTPLNSILGFSEVLDSIDALDEKQKRYVQNIQKSGRTLLEMINDILDLAKIESGKMDVRLERLPRRAGRLGAVRHGPAADGEEEHRHGDARIADDLPPMHQDQARVQQILNNLLSNAIKFTPEGGRITVSAARDDDFLVLRRERHGRGHCGGRSAGDFRKVPPRPHGRPQRRRDDARILRLRPGTVDRQGTLQAPRRRGLRPRATWAREARSRSACLGRSRSSRGWTPR